MDQLALAALGCGVLVPFLYYGAQLAAAPYFPDYSFVRDAASLLGSDLSTKPWVLNTGAILTGVATILAAFGYLVALRSFRTPVMAWLVFAALLSFGAGSIWAGSFPLPDPRHNPGPLGVGMFLVPVLLPLAVRKLPDATGLKVYLVVNLVLFLALMPIMSGAAGIDTQAYAGLLQRAASLILFVPTAVVAVALARRVRAAYRVNKITVSEAL